MRRIHLAPPGFLTILKAVKAETAAMAWKMIEDCGRDKRTQNIAADAEVAEVAEKGGNVDGRRVRHGSCKAEEDS